MFPHGYQIYKWFGCKKCSNKLVEYSQSRDKIRVKGVSPRFVAASSDITDDN